jgi:hypothetical protein
LKRDGTCAETRFRLSPKRTSPFKSAGAKFSWLLAAEVCASAGSECIIFSKYSYVGHSLKMSLQGGKQVNRSGERELVYNVYKFMKTESEVGINPSFKSAEQSH